MEQLDPCKECGAYKGHSPNCSLIEFDEAKKQLLLYYNQWVNIHREMNREIKKAVTYANKQASKAYDLSNSWYGKYAIVKHENNILRKRLYKRDGKIL